MQIIQINDLKNKKTYFYDKKNRLLKSIPNDIKKIPLGFPRGILYYPPRKNIYAIALDSKNRYQYFYEKKYKDKRRINKFSNNNDVIKNSIKILKEANKILKKEKNTMKYLIAYAILIISNCNFRVGNEKYQKLYNSYGTINFTLENVKKNKNHFYISFIGKKGEENKCEICKDNGIYEIINENYTTKRKNDIYRDKPFISYLDEKTGEIIYLKYVDIYNFFKKYEIRPKDIRMIQANIIFLKELLNQKDKMPEQEKEYKKWLKNIYDVTSKKMNNTLTVCKNEYVHPSFNKKTIRSMKLFINRLQKEENLYNFLDKEISNDK